jgi:murein DD-endopeptidase MepM/ murein hydrolase activator NlpD
MKFDVQTMAGGDSQLFRDARFIPQSAAIVLALVISCAVFDSLNAQELYKSRGADGEWIYSDRPPRDGATIEKRQLQPARSKPEVTVTHQVDGRVVSLTAVNQFYAPAELTLNVEEIRGLQYPDPEQQYRWLLAPRSETVLFTLDALEEGGAPFIRFEFKYLPGDPAALHRPTEAYRVPFAIASDFPVSQAYPDASTHATPDSYYAVDMAMPVGTDIFAARGGVVFDVASDNFRAGLDLTRDGPAANVIRILHDDGTYAIYAHLNWNTIRVQPGQRVSRGEYIADSGNTGFSTGPHLHFAVVQNKGMRNESLPVEFQGANTNAVSPASGMVLTAY